MADKFRSSDLTNNTLLTSKSSVLNLSNKNLLTSSSSLLKNTLLSSKTNLNLSSSSLTQSSILLLNKKPLETSIGHQSNLDLTGKKKKSDSIEKCDLDVKKLKILNDKLTNSNLPSLNNLLISSTLNSSKLLLSSSSSSKEPTFLHSAHANDNNRIKQPEILSKTNLSKLIVANETAIGKNENNIVTKASQAEKRPFSELEKSKAYFPETHSKIYSDENQHNYLYEEYVKVDSIIDEIEKQSKESELNFSKKFKRIKMSKTLSFSDDSNSISNKQLKTVQFQKNTLINAVSSSLLRQPNFKDRNDLTRQTLIKFADLVIQTDPEFILKLALYTRRELNIRVTANFLLCYAAFRESCRPFLQRFFKSSIMLPSDWIEVAEQYQLFLDGRINYGSLPSALRKCMIEKFPDFDSYQLAKYNKEKSRSANNKKLKDIKHIKSKLKDMNGDVLTGDSAIVEDKFIKSLKRGLKINDRILIELVANEKCQGVKIDIVYREETKKPLLVKGRSFKKLPQSTKDNNSQPEESVAVRINLDHINKRIVQKSYLNKNWAKRGDVNYLQIDIKTGFESIFLFVDISSSEFSFGIIKNNKESVLSKYSHSKHKIDLFKLNILRISGVDIKLKDLKIFSKDLIHLESQNVDETEKELKVRSYTLKQLIRQLHISNPVEHVMCLIGKKYPLTTEDFINSKLPGIYDSEKAGKRMKLPTPQTWETQISMHGNKAEVWEKLIDSKKLPYMAMLRNLRNMIKCGISEKHHQWVLKKLQDEGAVTHSKQFPFRFFSAYEVLDELEREFNEYLEWANSNEAPPNEAPPKPIKVIRRGKREKKEKQKNFTDMNYDLELLKRYKVAIDNALKVATTHNVSPIKGSTAIFLNLGAEMQLPMSNRNLGSKAKTIADIASLLALMFKYSCENSKLTVFDNTYVFTDFELIQGTILDNMSSLQTFYNSKSKISGSYRSSLLEILQDREYYDNLIFLSNDLSEPLFFQNFLRRYRSVINPNLLFVEVKLSQSECGLMENSNFDHENDITICGFSDSILRFVAEKGNEGQLTHIENIDKSYELPPSKKSKDEKNNQQLMPIDTMNKIERPALKILVPSSKWKNIKVFISSTFRDMHSERDILSKTVFPMLRSKLASQFINIYEIDMRWGITEAESNSNLTLDICLNQILNSDYFISMLGKRYGQTLSDYMVRSNDKLDWLNYYEQGASITELEIECQLRKIKGEVNEYEKSFFYFRDNSFINQVPLAYREHFESEDDMALYKLNLLKSKIKSKPFEIYNNYKCNWFKYEDRNDELGGRALLTDLDLFAQRVFNNLYSNILKHHQNEDEESNEFIHYNRLNEAYISSCADLFSGREKLIEKFYKTLKETLFLTATNASTESSKELIKNQNSFANIILVSGEPGCGKTSFICYFFENYLHESNIYLFSNRFVYCTEAFSGSEYISVLLKCFCIQMIRIYPFSQLSIEELANTGDINFLKKAFASILDQFKTFSNEKIYIVIDGVDMLLNENGDLDESFSWIPDIISPSVCFVFSARSTSNTKSILNKISNNNKTVNKVQLDIFEIENLDVLDKSEIVKSQLNQFNKKLDETPFNNQMKLLTGKRDAANPLYLKLACEEVRLYNHFESLNKKIKELPIRVNLMIQYVLERLENDYGKNFTNAVFMFITCSRDGLLEQELHELLGLYFAIEKADLFELIDNAPALFLLDRNILINLFNNQLNKKSSAQKFLSFLQTISQTFLKPRSDEKSSLINLKSHTLIENSIRNKYHDKSIAAQSSKLTFEFTNKIMSLYYWKLIDKKFELYWNSINHRALIYLPYHLSMAKSFQDIEALLCNIKFVALKCQQGLGPQLMDDIDFHSSCSNKSITTRSFNTNSFSISKKNVVLNKNSSSTYDIMKSPRFLEYKKFIISNYHILTSNPSLIYQQIINEPDDSYPANDLKEILKNEPGIFGYLFEWLNKPNVSNEKSNLLPLTINDFEEAVCSVAISSNGQVACGTENCEIKLYNMKTASLIKTFQGHSGRINQLCFVANDILCSASSDGIASLWNINGGFRIKVLNQHNDHVVSGCCSEPNGKSLITVGWDCNAKIWSSSEGNFLGELRGHPKPINCVIFNPEGNLVATGCWDSAIRIFNLVDRSRKAVLRGHKTSVRSISYSKNGVYLASSSIDGEVRLWNAKIGSLVASLKGHSMPVNCVRFSPNTQFLITGSTDRSAKVWSGSIGKMIRVIHDDNVKQPITSVCFNPKNGNTIVAGYHSGEIRIYETFTGNLKAELKPHNSFIRRLKFMFNGSVLISSANDGSIKLVDLRNLEKVSLLAQLMGNTTSVNAVAVNNDNVLIVGSEDCKLCVYSNLDRLLDAEESYFEEDDNSKKNTSLEKIQPNRISNAHKSPITACCFNSTGDRFASSSKDATIIVWNYVQFNYDIQELYRINQAHADWITDMQWSNSADFILTSSNDFTLKIWNGADGKERSTLTGHSANINSCSFQYGCAVSTCFDGSIKIWSHKGHEIATLLGHQGRVNSCDLFIKIKSKSIVNNDGDENVDGDGDDVNMESNDASWAEKVDQEEWQQKQTKVRIDKQDYTVEHVYLVTVSDDSTIRLWKPIESEYLISLEKHNDKINSLDINNEGMLVTASSDNSVNLWDMKGFFDEVNQGKFVYGDKAIKKHNAEITSICASEDGSFLISCSRDGIFIIWQFTYSVIHNGKKLLKGIKPIHEIQAHDKSCNKICILNQTNDNRNNSKITFATCSNDKSIKIWSLKENKSFSEIPNLELVRSINCKNPVFSVFFHSEKNQNYLVSVETESFKLLVKLYDINNNYSTSRKQGCEISNFNEVVHQIKATKNHLYIMIANEKLIRLKLETICKKFTVNPLSTIEKDSLGETIKSTVDTENVKQSNKNWYCCIDENDNKLVVGNWKGELFFKDSNEPSLKESKSVHNSRLTDIISFITKNNSARLLTSSQDGTVKLWDNTASCQLGQYSTRSGIVSMVRLSSTESNMNQSYNFAFGDQMGYLHVLRWHDEE